MQEAKIAVAITQEALPTAARRSRDIVERACTARAASQAERYGRIRRSWRLPYRALSAPYRRNAVALTEKRMDRTSRWCVRVLEKAPARALVHGAASTRAARPRPHCRRGRQTRIGFKRLSLVLSLPAYSEVCITTTDEQNVARTGRGRSGWIRRYGPVFQRYRIIARYTEARMLLQVAGEVVPPSPDPRDDDGTADAR